MNNCHNHNLSNRKTQHQLGKLAMFLKEATIMTLRVSRNVYKQNMKRLHNTTIAAITIANSKTNCIDHDEMNPTTTEIATSVLTLENQMTSTITHTSCTPQGGAVPTATSMTNCTQFPSSSCKDRINNGNSQTQNCK